MLTLLLQDLQGHKDLQGLQVQRAQTEQTEQTELQVRQDLLVPPLLFLGQLVLLDLQVLQALLAQLQLLAPLDLQVLQAQQVPMEPTG